MKFREDKKVKVKGPQRNVCKTKAHILCVVCTYSVWTKYQILLFWSCVSVYSFDKLRLSCPSVI